MDRARQVLPEHGMHYASGAYEACEGADALLLLTEWQDFRDLDFARIHEALRYPIVVDGRNLFPPKTMREQGFIYHSVGRPTAVPEHRLQASSAAVA
jgi:UDPglucose 6-dehydrogenase